jgi:hypothetical protein
MIPVYARTVALFTPCAVAVTREAPDVGEHGQWAGKAPLLIHGQSLITAIGTPGRVYQNVNGPGWKYKFRSICIIAVTVTRRDDCDYSTRFF